ncbi:MAG: hypothetical protein ACYC21_07905 [Eubacteriales bacterium]
MKNKQESHQVSELKGLKASLAKVKKRKANAQDLLLDGAITKDEYHEILQRLVDEQKILETKIEAINGTEKPPKPSLKKEDINRIF